MLRSVVICAAIAQLVERIHGKDEVSGSSPDRGSRIGFFTERSPVRAIESRTNQIWNVFMRLLELVLV